jgi:hypothetical protein
MQVMEVQMKEMTVKELRERARELGIVGFSKLRKEELLAAITEIESESTTAAPETEAPVATEASAIADVEQHIEETKYHTGAPATSYAPDLGEDIDSLPPLRGEPRIVLLAQKPGVLHAYWYVSPGHRANQPDLRLRLGLMYDRDFHVKEEIAIPSDQGTWYFHVDQSWHPATIYVQLGHYDEQGKFIIAIRRGIVRLPRVLDYTGLGVNWALNPEEFERARSTSGMLGSHAPGRWPQGPSSYELVSSHIVSSESSMRRG